MTRWASLGKYKMEPTELKAAIEAILFISNEPVTVDALAEAFAEEGREAVVAQLDEIKRVLDLNVGGFMLEQTAGGWLLATRDEHDGILKKYFARRGESRLSIAASRPVGMLGRSFGQPALSMSIALAFAARNSSSAGRCASVGCTTSEMRSIGQSVRSEALSLQTSAGRRFEPPLAFAMRRGAELALRPVASTPPPA